MVLSTEAAGLKLTWDEAQLAWSVQAGTETWLSSPLPDNLVVATGSAPSERTCSLKEAGCKSTRLYSKRRQRVVYSDGTAVTVDTATGEWGVSGGGV